MRRREFLGMSAAGVLSSCVSQRPEVRVLSSLVALPKAFEVALPRIPVLKPVRSDDSGDFYEMTARPGSAGIWGYEGVFPGPTI